MTSPDSPEDLTLRERAHLAAFEVAEDMGFRLGDSMGDGIGTTVRGHL